MVAARDEPTLRDPGRPTPATRVITIAAPRVSPRPPPTAPLSGARVGGRASCAGLVAGRKTIVPHGPPRPVRPSATPRRCAYRAARAGATCERAESPRGLGKAPRAVGPTVDARPRAEHGACPTPSVRKSSPTVAARLSLRAVIAQAITPTVARRAAPRRGDRALRAVARHPGAGR